MMVDAAAAALRLLPPETAHRATLALLKCSAPFSSRPPADDPRLAVGAFGLRFPSPIGLAAGFDKNATVADAMLSLGFGFVECGTVTPRPQTGSPSPRLFRLKEDRAVVNRLGFNNEGMERVGARLAARARAGIVGINIGANQDSTDRIADYVRAFARLSPFADYVAINVSSPNTPGLRGLQSRDQLSRLLGRLTDMRAATGPRMPLLVKIAPDIGLRELDDIAAIAISSGIEGLIVSNTTTARPSSLRSPNAREAGGLSGAPLFPLSTDLLREARARVGSKLALIGVGGVGSGLDAYAKIRAGASLVQLYTALAYEGAGLLTRIKRELLALLVSDGIANVMDVIGADVH